MNLPTADNNTGISPAAEAATLKLADWVGAADRLVVFTGAGISTESGIPDFRSPGGIWEKYKPILFQDFLASDDSKRQYWARSKATYPALVAAEPNPAHHAIAQLFRWGKLDVCITQNIDGLHQRSGLPDQAVIELHGTAMSAECLECGVRHDRAAVQAALESGVELPRCDTCHGPLKSSTVSFGQPMPERETAEAMLRSEQCDVFLVIGSSLVVNPAAQCPVLAKRGGAKVVILNREETEHDSYADLTIHTTAGPTMQALIDILRPAFE